jgi:DNA-binding beta-propeller fold protein YncE
LPIGNDRALVTDLYSRTISVVNLATCTLVSSIATGGWTEEMVRVGTRVYLAQTGTDKLLVIDVEAPSLVDSLYVGREPNSLAVDLNGRLWVLCGNALGQAFPQLVRVNLDSLRVEAVFPFGSPTRAPSKLIINAERDRLYFLDGGIHQMAVGDSALPTQPWVAQGSHTWYGLGLDPQTGYIYAGDALDYQRKGRVYRFSPNSARELASFEVGVIPGGFAFLP